ASSDPVRQHTRNALRRESSAVRTTNHRARRTRHWSDRPTAFACVNVRFHRSGPAAILPNRSGAIPFGSRLCRLATEDRAKTNPSLALASGYSNLDVRTRNRELGDSDRGPRGPWFAQEFVAHFHERRHRGL